MNATEIEVLESVDLATLASQANLEHEEVERAVSTALEHAIRAGEALLAAQQQVGFGGWTAWLDENFEASVGLARIYMRIAYYQDRLVNRHNMGIQAAQKELRGLPVVGFTPEFQMHEARAKAVDLRKQGFSCAEVADLFNCSPISVSRWTTEANLSRKEITARRTNAGRRAAERRALRQQADRDKAMRKIGGGVSELYADIHKLTQKADKVIENASSKEVRAGLNAALAKLHQARDEIVKAVGIA